MPDVDTKLDLTPLVVVGAVGIGAYLLIKSIKGPILPDIDLSFGIPKAAEQAWNAVTPDIRGEGGPLPKSGYDVVATQTASLLGAVTPSYDLFGPAANSPLSLLGPIGNLWGWFNRPNFKWPWENVAWRPGEMVIQPYRPIYTAGGVVQADAQGNDPRQAYWDQGGYRGGGL